MHSRSLIPKDLFVGIEGVAHLCTGGEAPMLRTARTALDEFCGFKSGGMAGRTRIVNVYQRAKEAVAAYLRAPGGVDDIAFLGHAAEGFSVLGSGIDWRAGDEIVSLTNEYPSSLLPWMARRQLGVELRAVEPGSDPEGAIEAVMTGRTRVICVSLVSYLTGVRLDLQRLGEIAHSKGAILAVDASHALGVLPIEIESCDILVSCCYKFLLATHGAGIFYWNRRRLPDLMQTAVGWHSIEWPTVEERSETYRLKSGAARFEMGNPPFISLFVLNEALQILAAVDPRHSEAHVLDLGAELRGGLVGLGLTPWTPERACARGPNIVFPYHNAEALVEQLAERGVLAWSGDGRVRFSLHAYNDYADVTAAIDGLRAIL